MLDLSHATQLTPRTNSSHLNSQHAFQFRNTFYSFNHWNSIWWFYRYQSNEKMNVISDDI